MICVAFLAHVAQARRMDALALIPRTTACARRAAMSGESIAPPAVPGVPAARGFIYGASRARFAATLDDAKAEWKGAYAAMKIGSNA